VGGREQADPGEEEVKYRLSIRDLAEQDLAEAYDFYESQSAGLGDQLHDEVAAVLNQMVENPRQFPHSELSPYTLSQ
jgi:hypothetical protein